jgi:hypothetical protein
VRKHSLSHRFLFVQANVGQTPLGDVYVHEVAVIPIQHGICMSKVPESLTASARKMSLRDPYCSLANRLKRVVLDTSLMYHDPQLTARGAAGIARPWKSAGT